MSWETTDSILDGLLRRTPIVAPVAVVVANPDDETIGAGANWLPPCAYPKWSLTHSYEGGGMTSLRWCDLAAETLRC